MSGSEIEKFREEINAMVGRAYRLGLDEARNRIAELEAEVKRLAELDVDYPRYLLVNERDEARGVARVIAEALVYEDFRLGPSDECIQTALAYPDAGGSDE